MSNWSKQILLVIAPHPDDEVLGCGGLMHHIKRLGGKVYIQFLTNGDTKDFSRIGSSSIRTREKEIKSLVRYYSLDGYHIAFTGNTHHLKLDAVGRKQVIDLIERGSPLAIERIKPTIITFPSIFSYNQDHLVTAQATHTALRPSEPKNKHYIKLVLAYEMPADHWSLSAHPPPNFFVPLTKKDLSKKLKGVAIYRSQLRPVPNPRSLSIIEALARLRGSHCGSEFAEAYHCYRHVMME